MRTLSCQCNSPSKRALHTSSFVAFSALSIIAMFCDFFGSRTLFSWLHKLEFGPLPPLLDDRLVEFETNNDSIITSFTLLSYKELNTLTSYRGEMQWRQRCESNASMQGRQGLTGKSSPSAGPTPSAGQSSRAPCPSATASTSAKRPRPSQRLSLTARAPETPPDELRPPRP